MDHICHHLQCWDSINLTFWVIFVAIRKSGNDSLLFSVVVKYFYRKKKNIALTPMLDTVICKYHPSSNWQCNERKNKFSSRTVLSFLLQKKKISKNGKNSIMIQLVAKECLSLYIQTNMSSTEAHLQRLPDLKNNGCKCQGLKITVVVPNCLLFHFGWHRN